MNSCPLIKKTIPDFSELFSAEWEALSVDWEGSSFDCEALSFEWEVISPDWEALSVDCDRLSFEWEDSPHSRETSFAAFPGPKNRQEGTKPPSEPAKKAFSGKATEKITPKYPPKRSKPMKPK